MNRRLPIRRSTIIMVGLAAFIMGLGLSARGIVLSLAWAIPASCLLIANSKRTNWITFVCVALIGLCLGGWRGGVFQKRLAPYQELYGRNVTVRLTASTDGTYTDGSLGFEAKKLEFLSPKIQKLPGVIKVEVVGLPAVYRSDRLEVSGKFYPAGGSKQGSIKFAQAKIIEHDPSLLERLRLEFVSGMLTSLPEPHGSFGLGLLIGQRTTLPEGFSKTLSIVGLTHIIAVSGYNLTILIRFVTDKLGRRSKFQIFVLSTFLICIFLIITGFSASIIRATLVSMLGLGAWYYGRTFRPVLILLLSAALTAGWYPVYLWSDIGWYLSFLAFFGVIVLAPLVTKIFWKGRKPWGLMPIVIESVCAQIMTAPLIIYIFNQASLVALISNMIIIPLVPFAMLLSLIAGLGGMFLPVISGWLAWPAKLLMDFMFGVIQALSKVPNASVDWSLTTNQTIIIYLLLLAFGWLLWRQTARHKYGTITDEIHDN